MDNEHKRESVEYDVFDVCIKIKKISGQQIITESEDDIRYRYR